jgi:endonuclease-3
VNRRSIRRRASRATTILREHYGSPRHDNKDDPLDEVVFIVLSQMTTHHSFGRVFKRLKEVAPSWDEVLRMPLEDLVAVIADAGLSNQKAPRIREILRRTLADFGSVTLEPLRAMSDQEAERYLCSLPGVGTKTAKCVMMYALGRPVLPVDTHVWRLARRLDLVGDDVPYGRVHAALEDVVAGPDRYAFHVNAIAHGRVRCLPRRPRCDRCPLLQLCSHDEAGLKS